MRMIALVGTLLFLAGCSPQPKLIETQHAVFNPGVRFRCEDMKTLPDPDTLTDAQTASLIAYLVTYGKGCYADNKALRDALNAASKTIDKNGVINGKVGRDALRMARHSRS